MRRESRRLFLSIIVLLTMSLALLSGSDNEPWYYGKRIAQFTNHNLVHVKESTILDLQYGYLGKPFTDALFDELQSKLYDLDSFLYFLADANRTGEGDNELAIDFTFYEKPYITGVTIEGNSGIKTKDIDGALLSKEGTFLDEQVIALSKERVLALYRE